MLFPLKSTDIALLNPYGSDDTMPQRVALRQAIRGQGVRLQVELLYLPGNVPGTRIGLSDESGFFAEYCFTRAGQMDARRFLHQAHNVNGKAPAFWATDLL